MALDPQTHASFTSEDGQSQRLLAMDVWTGEEKQRCSVSQQPMRNPPNGHQSTGNAGKVKQKN